MTGSGSDNSEASTPKPVLRLIRGNPTPEELGAVVALLAARSAAGDGEPEPAAPMSRWVYRGDLLRRPLSPGAGAWRASALRG